VGGKGSRFNIKEAIDLMSNTVKKGGGYERGTDDSRGKKPSTGGAAPAAASSERQELPEKKGKTRTSTLLIKDKKKGGKRICLKMKQIEGRREKNLGKMGGQRRTAGGLEIQRVRKVSGVWGSKKGGGSNRGLK